MHLLEFEKTWKEYKLVKPDGQSMPLVKIFRLEDNADISFYRGGLVLLQDVFVFKLQHVLRPKLEKERIFIERLISVGRGQTVWEVVGELVKLDQVELESLEAPISRRKIAVVQAKV